MDSAKASKAGKELKLQLEGAKYAAQQLGKKLRAAGDRLKSMRGAMLGFGLSVMFAGMALQKFFGGLARSFINTFMLVRGETSAFSQSIAKLQGGWEYLKYSIMEALERAGVIEWVTNKVRQLTEWVNNLSDEAKVKIGKAILMFVALGTVMLLVGQAVSFLSGTLGFLFAFLKAIKGAIIALGTAINTPIAFFLSLIALIIVMMYTWRNFLTMFIAKWKIALLEWKALGVKWASKFHGFILDMRIWVLEFKRLFINSFSSALVKITEKINSFINGLPDWAKKAIGMGNLSFSGFDTSTIDSEIKALKDYKILAEGAAANLGHDIMVEQLAIKDAAQGSGLTFKEAMAQTLEGLKEDLGLGSKEEDETKGSININNPTIVANDPTDLMEELKKYQQLYEGSPTTQ